MKTSGLLIMVVGAALLCGCGSTAPSELTGARVAYERASAGPAARLSPDELHKAQLALTQAEEAFKDDSDSYRTRDLAYVAQRKAEMAEAHASIAAQRSSATASNSDFQTAQGEILQERTLELRDVRSALTSSEQAGQATADQLAAEQSARLATETRLTEQRALMQEKSRDLNQARTALAVSEVVGQATTDQLTAEQSARLAAEKTTAETQAELAMLIATKDDQRGDYFTLSGGLIFRSNEATLMPGAETQLDRLVEALAATPDRNIVVEGYTDSQGSAEHNLDLSQRRADAVRSYLVHNGFPADQVLAEGIGEGRPIADNATSEGRANNRRVEIVLSSAAKF